MLPSQCFCPDHVHVKSEDDREPFLYYEAFDLSFEQFEKIWNICLQAFKLLSQGLFTAYKIID